MYGSRKGGMIRITNVAKQRGGSVLGGGGDVDIKAALGRENKGDLIIEY